MRATASEWAALLGCPPHQPPRHLWCAPRAARCRGISYDRSGDFDAAIADFKMAISISPNADFYHNLGFCYRCVGASVPTRK